MLGVVTCDADDAQAYDEQARDRTRSRGRTHPGLVVGGLILLLQPYAHWRVPNVHAHIATKPERIAPIKKPKPTLQPKSHVQKNADDDANHRDHGILAI